MQRIRVSSAVVRRASGRVWHNPISARAAATACTRTIVCRASRSSQILGTQCHSVGCTSLSSQLPITHVNVRSFHNGVVIHHGRHSHRDHDHDRDRDDHDHEHEHEHEHEHQHKDDKHDHASTPTAATTSTAASSKPSSKPSSKAEESSSLSPRAIAGQVRDGFNKLRATLHHYTLGSKLLWKNYKRSREIRRLLPANGFPSSRTDYLLLQRADVDFKLGVPFIFVFALPFVGYAAPIFAYFAPRYIPSTFHTGDQIKEFVMEDAKDARKTLVTGIEVYGFHSRACSLDRLRAFMRRVERGLGRVDDAREVEKLAPIFQQLTPRLNMFSKHHLSLFHRSLLHSSFIAEHLYIKKWLISDLDKWREAILKDDQLIRVSGVESLRTLQLAQALYARGIYRHPNYIGQMLALDQNLQLASVESKTSPNYVSDEDREAKLKTGEPPEAIVADWRNVLSSWIELHCKLNEEAVLRKNNVFLAPVPPPAAIPSVFATAAGIKDVNNTASRVVEKQLSLALAQFPTAFILHVPLLLRLPNSATSPFIVSKAKSTLGAATAAPAASA